MTTFTIGDSVTTTFADAPRGVVKYGPYRCVSRGAERYLVERPDGVQVSVPVSSISLALAFAVGDEVEERAMGRAVTIEAGPFKAAGNQDRYVVKFASTGQHAWVGASGLRQRQAPLRAPFEANTYFFRGRTYSLDAEYTDRQGDVWKFNGHRAGDAMPLMNCELYQTLSRVRLDNVLAEYGPLSRS